VRFRALLLAAICVLASGGARAEEATWVFEFYQPYMEHFCWNGTFTPYVDVPWEDVAYGVFEFDLWRQAGFATEDPVSCTLSYSNQQVVIWREGIWKCPDWTDCYDGSLTATRTFEVFDPVSPADFAVTLSSSYCYLACGSIECTPYGLITGTLSLYAKPTATDGASWSTVKAMY
jgi:hypothetical protein